MQSKADMANRLGDVDLCFVQVSAPQLELWLGYGLNLAVITNIELTPVLLRELRKAMVAGKKRKALAATGDRIESFGPRACK